MIDLAWMQRLLTDPVDQMSRWRRAVRYAADLSRHCVAELRHDRANQVAAALTYHTLFSLLPTIVLAMVVMQFVGPAEREHFKTTVVEYLLPQAADHDLLDEAQTPVALARLEEIAKGRHEIAIRVQEVMDSLSKMNFTGMGLVGLLIFIYGATGLLSTIEKSFNAIYGVAQARAWYHRLPFHYTIITLAPVVLIAGQVLQKNLFKLLGAGAWTNWLVGPVALFTPLLATWLVVFAMYTLLPNVAVQRRAAAIGSFVAAVLWVSTKDLFRLYVAHAAGSNLYGALGLLPLFLLWLYLTWLIVLFGLELTYALSAMKDRQFKYLALQRKDEPLIDSAWIIPLSAQIAAGFEQGNPVTAEALGRALNVSPRSLLKMLVALQQAGLINRIAQGSADAYTLARPASQITVGRILDVAHTLMPTPAITAQSQTAPAWNFIQQLQTASRQLTEQTTLADLYAPGPSPAASQVQSSPPSSRGAATA